MLPVDLAVLARADILALVENRVRESRVLELKEQLPGMSDTDKREFIADATAFANSLGGDLVFGVSEDDGVAVDAVGLAITDADEAVRRLLSLLRDAASPPLASVQAKVVEGFSRGPCVVLRIPASYRAPHAVVLGKRLPFYERHDGGKNPMDVEQLRASFLAMATIADRINDFRERRVGQIVGNEFLTWASEPTLVLHVIPFSAFTRTEAIDMRTLQAHRAAFVPMTGTSESSRPIAEGLLVRGGKRGNHCSSFCLAFRSGIVESASAEIVDRVVDGKRVIASWNLERDIIRTVEGVFTTYRSLGIAPPCAVLASLHRASNVRMAGHADQSDRRTGFDRDRLNISPVVIDDYGTDVGSSLRPLLDALWNASGFVGSPHYDGEGNWKAPP